MRGGGGTIDRNHTLRASQDVLDFGGQRMKPPCPDCGHTHTATDSHALRRFEPTLAHTFAATYPGAPERTTRAAAERDMCRHRQEQTR